MNGIKLKEVLSFILVLLVFVLIVGGLGYLSGGFRNWDITKWFETKNAVAMALGIFKGIV